MNLNSHLEISLNDGVSERCLGKFTMILVKGMISSSEITNECSSSKYMILLGEDIHSQRDA